MRQKYVFFFCHPFIFDLEQDLFCKGFSGVIFCKKPRKTLLWIVIIKSQEQKIGKIYKWNDKTAQPKSFQNRSKDFLYNIFLKKMLVYIDIYRQKKNIYIFLAPVCKKFCRPVFIILFSERLSQPPLQLQQTVCSSDSQSKNNGNNENDILV